MDFRSSDSRRLSRHQSDVEDANGRQWRGTDEPSERERMECKRERRRATFCRYRFNSSLDWKCSGRRGGARRRSGACRSVRQRVLLTWYVAEFRVRETNHSHEQQKKESLGRRDHGDVDI